LVLRDKKVVGVFVRFVRQPASVACGANLYNGASGTCVNDRNAGVDPGEDRNPMKPTHRSPSGWLYIGPS
jgi:hypothetical protein